MKILIINGCWSPNIGNAFVNLGLEVIIKKAFSDCEIVYSSEPNNRWFIYTSGNDLSLTNNSFDISSSIQVDLVVWGGMMLTKEFVDTAGEVFLNYSRNNIPILLIGAGADKYSDEEREYVADYLKQIMLLGLITRDDDTYEMFADYEFLKGKIIKGIDCAFFLSEYASPKMNGVPYDVECFDRIPTPYIDHRNKDVVVTHHDSCGIMPTRYLRKSKTLISELPYDYLTVYKNADAIYAERVHACIIGLAYGKRVQLFSDTQRASLFQRVLPEDITLNDLKSYPVYLDINKLKQRQSEVISAIKDLMASPKDKLLQVYIETSSSCNRRCPYCQHGNDKLRPAPHVMEQRVFDKVIKDLQAIDYDQLIYLYDKNEPLLDTRMPKLIKQVSENLPKARIFLFSNGDLATYDLIKEFFNNGLTHFVFSLHDYSNYDNIMKIVEKIGREKFTIADMTQLADGEFNNLGGAITDSEKVSQKTHNKNSCILPFIQVPINSYGEIRLCCSITDEVKLGNVMDVNLIEYFHNDKKLNMYRDSLFQIRRNNLSPCELCSFDGNSETGLMKKLDMLTRIELKKMLINLKIGGTNNRADR